MFSTLHLLCESSAGSNGCMYHWAQSGEEGAAVLVNALMVHVKF